LNGLASRLAVINLAFASGTAQADDQDAID